MNSKERIRATVQHQQPDHVASTMQCVQTAWDKLKKYFNVETEDEVMDILDIDTRIMDLPPYIGPDHPDYVDAQGETVHTHPFGQKYIEKWNGVEYNWHTIYRPLQDVHSLEDLAKFHDWPNPDDYDYEAVKRFCDKHQDKAIRIGWPGPYQVFLEMYPAEEFYCLMAEDPDLVKAMLNRYSDFYMELYERMFECRSGQRSLTRPISPISMIIRMTMRIWTTRWAKSSGALWSMHRGIMRMKKISGRICGPAH
jgi:uroporphyrinogen decarboxylase